MIADVTASICVQSYKSTKCMMKDKELLERVQWWTTQMINGLEHLLCKEGLVELGFTV